MSWDDEYTVPPGTSIQGLAQRLRKLMPCKSDRAQTVERTFLDTFDWRLYARDRVLEERRQDNDEITLHMRTLHKTAAVGPITSNGNVRFVRDVPAGTLRRRLASVVQMRALLPMVRISSKINTLRILDKNGKTVVYVELETNSLVDGPHRAAEAVLQRARVIPLRGYTKKARHLSRLLVEVLGCAPSDVDVLQAAARLAGRQPGDYSAKLDIRLDSCSPADAALRLVFRRLLEIMRRNENGIREQIDSEFLHDFRVALRRTRSALAQMQQFYPKKSVERYLRDFRWLQQTTGVARDMDVYLLKFDQFEKLVDPSLRKALPPLKDFLGQQREIAYRRLVRSLDSARYRRLLRDWQSFIDQRLTENPNPATAMPPIADVARDRIWRVYRRAMKKGRSIEPTSPADDLHELRKTCKKLRYLLEFFQSLFPQGKLKTIIGSLKQLQDNLGEFNDLQVQSEVLKTFSARMYAKKQGEPETLMAIGVIIQALLKRKNAERATFHAHFEAFAQPAVQNLFRELCRPPASDRAP